MRRAGLDMDTAADGKDKAVLHRITASCDHAFDTEVSPIRLAMSGHVKHVSYIELRSKSLQRTLH